MNFNRTKITAHGLGGAAMVSIVLLHAFVILIMSAAEEFRAVDVRALKIGRFAVASLSTVAGGTTHPTQRRALQIFASVQHLAVVMTFVAVASRQIGTFVAVSWKKSFA